MPRRLIESEIFVNEKVGNLTVHGRLLFIGIVVNADDDGRLKASPKYLKALIYPYDNDVTAEMVKEWRDKCHDLKLLSIYSQNGTEYLYLPTWLEHQQIRTDRYKPSQIPPPIGYNNETNGLPNDNQEATNGNKSHNDLANANQLPSDNQATTAGLRNISKDNISKDNISSDDFLKVNKKLKKYPPEFVVLRKQVFDGLKERRGYPSPSPSQEALAISEMLKRYTPEQILDIWDKMKIETFWQDKELSMTSVRKQIGAKLNLDTVKPSVKYGHMVKR